MHVFRGRKLEHLVKTTCRFRENFKTSLTKTFLLTTDPDKLHVQRHNRQLLELKHLTCCNVEAPPPTPPPPPPSTDATSYKRSCLPLPLLQSLLKHKHIFGVVVSVSAATLRGTSCQPSTCSAATIARPAAPAVTLHPSLPPVRGTRDRAGGLVMKTFSRPLEQTPSPTQLYTRD